VHVILLADAGICIPAPLGNGACNGADEKLPTYRHVLETVNSTDALQKFISTYPQWKDALRPDATKTFAVVSDDDSDLSAASFTAQLQALDPPTFQNFKFDAIVSFDDPGVCTVCLLGGCAMCASKCCDTQLFCAPISAAEGKVYKQLVQQTGGVIGDLCTQNFGPVFADMGTAVVQGSSISCSYDIPKPAEGDGRSRARSTCSYTPGGGGAEQAILAAPGGVSGCGQKGGWYYDDPMNPTKIIMCPTTCAALQGDSRRQGRGDLRLRDRHRSPLISGARRSRRRFGPSAACDRDPDPAEQPPLDCHSLGPELPKPPRQVVERSSLSLRASRRL
jgi:hypothetical protein